MQIRMSDAEVKALSECMLGSDSYFEYGMGGSTCLATKLVSRRVSAIDSDPQWVEKVRAEINANSKEIVLTHVDIGPTREWGYPRSKEQTNLFPRYSNAILDEPEEVDLCLVDGRFRVSCFLTALTRIPTDGIIAIHDFAERPHYHEIESFARRVALVDTLGLFVRRRDASPEDIMKRAEAKRFDPR